MGLLSRLFSEAVKRVEASPGYQAVAEQHERTEPYESAAPGLAYSTLTDEEACTRLRKWIGGGSDALREAVESSARSRRGYISDRAYRLLNAAASNEPVQPIDPATAELFRAEEDLGRLPLGEAFDRLAEREPKLARLRAEAEAEAASRPPDDRWKGYQERNARAHRLLREHLSRADDPLLGTFLARHMAAEYLRAIAEVGPPGDLTTPFFDDLADTDLGERPPPSPAA